MLMWMEGISNKTLCRDNINSHGLLFTFIGWKAKAAGVSFSRNTIISSSEHLVRNGVWKRYTFIKHQCALINFEIFLKTNKINSFLIKSLRIFFVYFCWLWHFVPLEKPFFIFLFKSLLSHPIQNVIELEST